MPVSNKKAGTNSVIKLGDHEINEIFEFKDLEVLFNKTLSFSNHIINIVAKAKQRLFLLHKSFITKDVSSLIKAYKTYVLSIVEYCSQIWSAYQAQNIVRSRVSAATFY